MQLTIEAAKAAIEQHKTVFFDRNLNPVMPQQGQWFCEFDDENGDANLIGGALVEYMGLSTKALLEGDTFVEHPSHRVAGDYLDGDREPRGLILILQ